MSSCLNVHILVGLSQMVKVIFIHSIVITWMEVVMSVSTVFQVYQDDWRMVMKGCMQINPVYS